MNDTSLYVFIMVLLIAILYLVYSHRKLKKNINYKYCEVSTNHTRPDKDSKTNEVQRISKPSDTVNQFKKNNIVQEQDSVKNNDTIETTPDTKKTEVEAEIELVNQIIGDATMKVNPSNYNIKDPSQIQNLDIVVKKRYIDKSLNKSGLTKNDK